MSRNGRGGAISRAIQNEQALRAELVHRNPQGKSWVRRGMVGFPLVCDLGDGAISLTNQTGRTTIIDRTDWEALGKPNIIFRGNKASIIVGGAWIILARALMSPGPGQVVDHINGNPADNRGVNLRVCCSAENNRNTALFSNNTSGFKGVCRSTRSPKPFRAYALKSGRQVSLGTHETAQEAARAYDAFAREHFGEFACLNFPNPGEQSVHRGELNNDDAR